MNQPGVDGLLVNRTDQVPEELQDKYTPGEPFAGLVGVDRYVTLTELPAGGYLTVSSAPLTEDGTLVEEVSARAERVDQDNSPVFSALDELAITQREIAATIDRMEAATAQLEQESTVAVDVEAEMGALDLEEPARTLLLAPLKAWTTMHGIVEDHINQLEELLGELDQTAGRTRLRIALTRRHAEAQVVGETDDLDELERLVGKHQYISRRVEQKIASVSSIMEVPLQLIDGWLTDTSTEQVGPLVDKVRDAHASATKALAQLASLARALQEESAPALGQLRDAVDGHA